MKKFFIVAAGLLLAICANAQTKPSRAVYQDYKFTTVKANPITSVKDQNRSGTCWVFSTLGFVESEVIRINKIKDESKYPDFSEMFVVSKSYQARAERYLRMDGHLNFAAGSECEDVLHVIRDFGLVPNKDMVGLNYGTDKPVHGELDAVAKAYVDAMLKNPNKTLSPAWKKGFEGIMDAYLGTCPENFTVDGKNYTPASYRDALKFNPDDYVSLTSFTHHPFYTWVNLEICDNWRGDVFYNIPVDEMMAVIDNAIDKGYTLAWGADVSDYGFARDGIAAFVDQDNSSTSGSDQERWVGKDDTAKAAAASDSIVEKNPTQESRQKDFDNKTMTDDHGMQIYGIAKDQYGKKYYMVKNSWGLTGRFYGIWYVTEPYVKGQTLSILVHKDALTADVKAKLGIK